MPANKLAFTPRVTGSGSPAADINAIAISHDAIIDNVSANTAAVVTKVDKVAGKSLLPDTEATRLVGMATGATANASDAQLRDRTTHTGLIDRASLPAVAVNAPLSILNAGTSSETLTLTQSAFNTMMDAYFAALPGYVATDNTLSFRANKTFTATGTSTPALANPVVSFGTSTATSQVVNWTTVPNATSYTVKRGATLIYTGALLTFTDTGLTAATAYTYAVQPTATGYTSGLGTGTVTTSAAPAGGTSTSTRTAVVFTNPENFLSATANTLDFSTARGFGYAWADSNFYIPAGAVGDFRCDISTAGAGAMGFSPFKGKETPGATGGLFITHGATNQVGGRHEGTYFGNSSASLLTPGATAALQLRVTATDMVAEYTADGTTWTTLGQFPRSVGNMYLKVFSDNAPQITRNVTHTGALSV